MFWLDPMPLADDLWKAYASYYTHAPDEAKHRGFIRRFYQRVKAGYLASQYGYRSNALARPLPGFALRLLPLRRSEVDAEVRYLPAKAGARLLDVGCGSGEWLVWMRRLGWQVEGTDFDPEAIRVAAQQGLTVYCGALEQQRLAPSSYDAVTLNQVIEHVPDPLGTLRECARILKPGGDLVLLTPNTASVAHRLFRQNWRGLEHPRHLHLFNPRSLSALLKSAGFNQQRIFTINSAYVWQQTWALWRGRSHRFAPGLLTFLEQLALPLLRGCGETLAAKASKAP